MERRHRSLEEIRQAGIEALGRELGPTNLIRFLQQFDTGRGDYTKERGAWAGDLTVDEIAESIEKGRPRKT